MAEGFTQRGFQLRRVFHANAFDAHGLGHCCEVRVFQVAAHVGKPRRFHFHLDKAERAVVQHNDLDGQAHLIQRQKVAHHHRETAVTRHRHHLPVREGCLRTNGLQHGIGHGAVVERPDQTPLAVHLQITRCPGSGRADVAGENGVVIRQFADQSIEVLRVNDVAVWPAFGQRIEVFPGLFVVLEGRLQVITVGVLYDLGQHGL